MRSKKINMIFLTICLFFVGLIVNPLKINANNMLIPNSENISPNIIQLIENNGESMTGTNITISEVQYVLDTDFEPNYILVTLDNGGYIISSIDGKISEMSLNDDSNPYQNCINVPLVYAGAFNYYKYENGILINIKDNTLLHSGFNEKIRKKSQEFIETSKNEIRSSVSNGSGGMTWHGITSSRFSRYAGSGWINNGEVGYCGPYAAAIMMAYCDDYVNDNLIPASVRTRNSSNPGTLITKLISLTPHANETLPNHVSTGINSFISNYSIDTSFGTSTNLYGTYAYVKLQCDNNRPICVGTIKGDYGQHWVTVYQYAIGTSTKYYRCVDNWGEYEVYFDYSWTLGSVYLTNV